MPGGPHPDRVIGLIVSWNHGSPFGTLSPCAVCPDTGLCVWRPARDTGTPRGRILVASRRAQDAHIARYIDRRMGVHRARRRAWRQAGGDHDRFREIMTARQIARELLGKM